MAERHRFLLCLALALAPPGGAAAREWFTLELEGQRAGWAWRESEATASGVVEREHLVLELAQAGRTAHVEQSIELARDAAGELASARLDAVAGSAETHWRATREDDALHVESDPSGSARVAVPTGTLLPAEEPRRLAALGAGGADYALFDPISLKTVQVHAEAVDAADGLRHVRTRRRLGGIDRVQDYWLRADGAIEKIRAQFVGLRLAWLRCEADCDRPVDPPFDPMTRLVVRAPVDIPMHRKQERIRYVLSRGDNARPRLVATSEQQVAYDGDRAIVTVCADCARDEPRDAQELARYLAPNPWVQSDAPEIVELARTAGGARRPVAQRMLALVWIVRERMNGPVDFIGYADAAQALRTGRGDCSEHAVLLAALARASGIPARVVFGLAYNDRFGAARDVFSPHAWVQAWDGRRWLSFDAALGAFDATHIALAFGTGDPNEIDADFRQLRALRIESVALARR